MVIISNCSKGEKKDFTLSNKLPLYVCQPPNDRQKTNINNGLKSIILIVNKKNKNAGN